MNRLGKTQHNNNYISRRIRLTVIVLFNSKNTKLNLIQRLPKLTFET